MPVRTQQSDSDDGFTLVEVIVAMLIFTIILTGFLYTMTASLTSTRDTRARVVAANLASQQIDVLRSAADVFTVVSDSYSTELNGDTFHVRWDANWVPDTGGTISCEAGAATGSLAYLHVTVEVKWENMRQGAQPVYSDTSLTPRTKINDPTLGTVLVGVIDANGDALPGAKVSTSAGGVADATTNSDGCAYLLKVPEGTHTITVTKSDHVNEQQLADPKATVPVTKGGTSRVSFTLAPAAVFRVSYGPNVSSAARIPKNLTTTFVSTYGNFPMGSTNMNNPKDHRLYPVPAGYTVLAGSYVESTQDPAESCLAPDPSRWAPGEGKVGVRPVAVAGVAGSVTLATVPMGEILIDGANDNGSPWAPANHLRARYVGGGAGDPGCPAGMEFTFGDIIKSNKATIALPYGTWELYRGGSGSQDTKITSGIIVPSGDSVASGRVVLDPRVPE